MDFTDIVLDTVAVRVSQYPSDDKPEFLIVGKSNVGKSSFINALANRKNLARISAKPGKTQTLNFYLINDKCYLIDVPGYGYAKISNKKQEKFGLMVEDYIKNRPNLKHVFLLIDFRHKPSENDMCMYNFLKYYNLPVTIICTKYDKVKSSIKERQKKIISNIMDIALGDNIIYFSSINKVGKVEVEKTIMSYI